MRNHHPQTSDDKPTPDPVEAPQPLEAPVEAPVTERLPHIPAPINNPPYEPPPTPSSGTAGVPDPDTPPA